MFGLLLQEYLSPRTLKNVQSGHTVYSLKLCFFTFLQRILSFILSHWFLRHHQNARVDFRWNCYLKNSCEGLRGRGQFHKPSGSVHYGQILTVNFHINSVHYSQLSLMRRNKFY